MVAAGQQPHLAAEPRQRHLVAGQVGRQHLQGHQPAQRQLPGQVDHPHAAAADLGQDLVIAQDRATAGAAAPNSDSTEGVSATLCSASASSWSLADLAADDPAQQRRQGRGGRAVALGAGRWCS